MNENTEKETNPVQEAAAAASTPSTPGPENSGQPEASTITTLPEKEKHVGNKEGDAAQASVTAETPGTPQDDIKRLQQQFEAAQAKWGTPPMAAGDSRTVSATDFAAYEAWRQSPSKPPATDTTTELSSLTKVATEVATKVLEKERTFADVDITDVVETELQKLGAFARTKSQWTFPELFKTGLAMPVHADGMVPMYDSNGRLQKATGVKGSIDLAGGEIMLPFDPVKMKEVEGYLVRTFHDPVVEANPNLKVPLRRSGFNSHNEPMFRLPQQASMPSEKEQIMLQATLSALGSDAPKLSASDLKLPALHKEWLDNHVAIERMIRYLLSEQLQAMQSATHSFETPTPAMELFSEQSKWILQLLTQTKLKLTASLAIHLKLRESPKSDPDRMYMAPSAWKEAAKTTALGTAMRKAISPKRKATAPLSGATGKSSTPAVSKMQRSAGAGSGPGRAPSSISGATPGVPDSGGGRGESAHGTTPKFG